MWINKEEERKNEIHEDDVLSNTHASAHPNTAANTIKKLPVKVIARIAAGEVIISPFNIIKELIENSIDAGSTSIKVRINSELSNVTIQDNGTGIKKEDLEFVCQNHYTSKMEKIEDLRSINSYGFRGEALYSISQCSKVKIVTKGGSSNNSSDDDSNNDCSDDSSNDDSNNSSDGCSDDNSNSNHSSDDSSDNNNNNNSNIATGHVAFYEEGEMIESKEVAVEQQGTTIEITDIFYNNAMRREKYYKNKNELMKCVELVMSYGIIHEGIECRVDGKLHSPVDYNNSLVDYSKLERYKDKIRAMVPDLKYLIHRYNDSVTVIFSDKEISLNKPKFILFINGRLVRNEPFKNRAIHKLRIESKNKELNPFVFVKIETRFVDVNIHPSKEEVLIGEEGLFEEAIRMIDNVNSSAVIEVNSVNSVVMEGGTVIDNCNSINNNSSSNTVNRRSPFKIYSSPCTKTLHETFPSSPSIKNETLLSSQIKDPQNIQTPCISSFIFVGSFNGFIFTQHQSNLIKIPERYFLYNGFLQKIKNEVGNFESVEYSNDDNSIQHSDMDSSIYRERYGIHIENNQIIAVPRIFNVTPSIDDILCCMNALSDCNVVTASNVNTLSNWNLFEDKLAQCLSKITCTKELFNAIKKEIDESVLVKEMRLLIDLRELYKTFDRC